MKFDALIHNKRRRENQLIPATVINPWNQYIHVLLGVNWEKTLSKVFRLFHMKPYNYDLYHAKTIVSETRTWKFLDTDRSIPYEIKPNTRLSVLFIFKNHKFGISVVLWREMMKYIN